MTAGQEFKLTTRLVGTDRWSTLERILTRYNTNKKDLVKWDISVYPSDAILYQVVHLLQDKIRHAFFPRVLDQIATPIETSPIWEADLNTFYRIAVYRGMYALINDLSIYRSWYIAKTNLC